MEKTKEILRESISKGFLKVDKVHYERGEHKFTREVVNRGDAVAGLLYNSATKKYIFVKQFRPGAGKELIEIIAGTMDVEGETPEDCLRREILEETGYVMTGCQMICSAFASPGGSTEKMHIFQVVTNGEKSGVGGGVGDEGIEIIEYTDSELVHNLGLLVEDLKTFIALVYEMESGPLVDED
jgi:nudix-type nucleoside diphosphatase (YffH/AdpP family)